MADLSTTLANKFELNMAQQNAPATEIVNARMQRIQEFERVRQEHASTSNPPGGDAQARLSRRDRLVHPPGTLRSSGGRNFAVNVQRTPLRTQSFENTSLASAADEEQINFREMFDSTRENLFRTRTTGSNESLSSATSMGRRPSDTLLGTRSSVQGSQTGTDSGSGSNAPKDSSLSWDITDGLAEAFSSIRASLLGSDTSLSTREGRSSSITRDTQNNSTNVPRYMTASQNATAIASSRSQTVRESRREQPFRRRTIQGVDKSLTQALEQERMSSLTASSQGLSRNVFQAIERERRLPADPVSQTLSRTASQYVTHATTVTQSSDSLISSKYKTYSSYKRVIEIYPEDSRPVLGMDDEQVVFVDSNGHYHWLNKHHQLVKAINAMDSILDIVVKPKLEVNKHKDNETFIQTIEGEEKERYCKLRDLVNLSKRRAANFENGDSTDLGLGLSLIELYRQGEFINDNEDIDEKYKSTSLYTPPRPRPDVKNLFSTEKISSIYEGIERVPETFTSSAEEVQPLVASNQMEGGPDSYQLSHTYTSSDSTSTAANNSSTTLHISHGQQHDGSEVGYTSHQSNNTMGQSINVQSTHEVTEQTHDATESIFRNSVNSDDIDLVLKRLLVMQGNDASEIDTSHLDLEEMRMIQQALLDNPSPPESPVETDAHLEFYLLNDHDSEAMTVVSDDINSINAVTTRAPTIPASQSAFIFRPVPNSSINYGSSSEVATTSSGFRNGSFHDGPFLRDRTGLLQLRESQISHTLSTIEASPTEPSPTIRPQILSEDSEIKLNLASKFTFGRISEEAEHSIQQTEENKNNNSSVSVDELDNPNISNTNTNEAKPLSVKTELTIHIPNNSDTSHSSNSVISDDDSSKTPISVRYSSGNLSDSEMTSPDDNEMVTTVFEEFVQTIPRSMLASCSSETS